ncbi:glycosyltransferase family 4 protein [Novosphingobium soli]|uniref:Glycosyltransferase family 4 protein n=1 Tax=Novosphingobium soli TaxID=574956 RepID=A0ABV6CXZ6_9SPHN
MLPIYINGKFYAGPRNGVRRVADRLVREIDRLAAHSGSSEVTLLLPDVDGAAPDLRNVRVEALGHAPTQMWEQARLPGLAQDGLLVNLGNLAPLRHRRKVTLLHDAQFLFPDSSYPRRQRLGYRLLVPHIARTSAAVLTVSHYARRTLEIMGIAPAARTGVLYNGADHILDTPADESTLDRLALSPRGYALMFGSGKAYKNNAVVFAAWSHAAAPRLPLVVVGATRSELAAQGLHPPPGTVFAGACDDAALRALYAHARCLLCPSRTEGFGLPPLEAMLCGTPAVVAPAGALPEVCRDAVLYADVDDPASWAQAVAALDPASALHACKVAQGRERARAFTWERAGRDLFETLNRLAGAEDSLA